MGSLYNICIIMVPGAGCALGNLLQLVTQEGRVGFMKKRGLCVLLAVGLLVGALPGQALAADFVSSADYSVERHDFSWYEDGKLQLLQYYDQVVVNDAGAAAQRINSSLQQHCNDFYAEVPDNIAQAQEMPPYYPGQYYQYYYEPEVTTNQDGILSVKMGWFWNFGGIDDCGSEEFNFDLNTGETLDLSEIFSLSDAEIERYFKIQTLNFINSHPDYPWWNDTVSDARQIVNNYSLDDFNYYIEGNTVVLVYEKYELGPGAMGMVEVPCSMINNTIDVVLNGQALSFDQPPMMVNNRVMVPIRAIFEALGYTVDWDQASQTGTASNGTQTITVQVGNAAVTHDGGTYWCDVAPKNVSGRILVPLRAISESAGCQVLWNQTTKKVIIEA